MQDVLATGSDWFEAQRREHLAATVEYRPLVGLARSCRATLVVGRWEAVTKDGQVVRMETRDFLIHRDELTQSPKRGDKIAVTENGIDKLYEVSIPAGMDNPWRWSDRSESLRRIHTQSVQATSATSTALLVRAAGVWSGSTISDAEITANLSVTLGSTRALTATLAPASEYVYVVVPTSFGTPTLKLNGFVSTAWETVERSITFSGQAARSYTVYRSTYAITGTATVEVA